MYSCLLARVCLAKARHRPTEGERVKAGGHVAQCNLRSHYLGAPSQAKVISAAASMRLLAERRSGARFPWFNFPRSVVLSSGSLTMSSSRGGDYLFELAFVQRYSNRPRER